MQDKSSIIEILLAIGIFAICAAICANVFFAAYYHEQRASDLTNATFRVQAVAEYARQGKIAPGLKQRYFNGEEGTWQTFFDKNWREDRGEDVVFILTYHKNITSTKNGDMESGNIIVRRIKEYPFMHTEENDILVDLYIKNYLPDNKEH
jgi:type II secretory pathway pseudopilin PulG